MKEALELYDIVKEYLPDAYDKTVLEFAGTIIDNIVKDQSSAYIDAICLMTKYTLENLQLLSSEDRLILFMNGLMKNDIISLHKFCKEIKYA